MIPTKIFVEAVKNYNLTKEDLERSRERFMEIEKKFQDQEKRSRVTQEWLNKPFSRL